MRSVLTVLANEAYIEQAKQLFSAAYWRAGWPGDYLLLAYQIPDALLQWFRDRSILIRECGPFLTGQRSLVTHILAAKVYLFGEEFRRWDRVVYLDTDIIIRAPLTGLEQATGFAACRSLWQTIADNIADPEAAAEIGHTHDLGAPAFNAGVFAFETALVTPTTKSYLQGLLERYIGVSPYYDQLALNLFFAQEGWTRLPQVYNRTVHIDDSRGMDPAAVRAIVIHLVGLGNGPWTPGSAFNQEWRHNLSRADQIDLVHIPTPTPWTPKQIDACSQAIVRQNLMDGKPLTVGRVVERAGRFLTHLRTNPRAAARKLCGVVADVLGSRGR